MRATWYVLEDGTAVDPADCAHDEMGHGLTHKSGARVAMSSHNAPMSRGVEIDEGMAKYPDDVPAKTTVDMRPEKRPAKPRGTGYKTRNA